MADPANELEFVRDRALELPGVVGIGREDGNIVVFTRQRNPEAIAQIDRDTRVPVREDVIGDVGAAVPGLRASGPFMGGCNAAFPARKNGEAYVVTAYHCTLGLQPGDSVVSGLRTIGVIDDIPQVTDAGADAPSDLIVDSDYVTIKINNAQPLREVERLDKPLAGGFYDPQVGDTVVKEGDRTGVSSGTVFAKDVTVVSPAQVSGYGGSAQISNLIGINTTVAPGDSGGAVMYEADDHYRPVGAVYGGTPQSTLFAVDMGYTTSTTGVELAGEIPQVKDGWDGRYVGGEQPPELGDPFGPSRRQFVVGAGALGLLAFAITNVSG